MKKKLLFIVIFIGLLNIARLFGYHIFVYDPSARLVYPYYLYYSRMEYRLEKMRDSADFIDCDEDGREQWWKVDVIITETLGYEHHWHGNFRGAEVYGIPFIGPIIYGKCHDNPQEKICVTTANIRIKKCG